MNYPTRGFMASRLNPHLPFALAYGADTARNARPSGRLRTHRPEPCGEAKGVITPFARKSKPLFLKKAHRSCREIGEA